MQVELDDVLKFIGQVEQKEAPNHALLASFCDEEAAIRARMAAVPAPVLDRSALTKKLNALTGAVSRAENEKKQQMASYDKELAALKVRIEKIAKAEQVLAEANKDFSEVQAQLAVAAPPPGVVPLFATVQQLQEYLVQNPAVVDACFGHASFVAHFAPAPPPAPATASSVKMEPADAKRSAEYAFGVHAVEIEEEFVSGIDASGVAEGPSGALTPNLYGESVRERSRSPVPAVCSSCDAAATARQQLAEVLEQRP